MDLSGEKSQFTLNSKYWGLRQKGEVRRAALFCSEKPRLRAYRCHQKHPMALEKPRQKPEMDITAPITAPLSSVPNAIALRPREARSSLDSDENA